MQAKEFYQNITEQEMLQYGSFVSVQRPEEKLPELEAAEEWEAVDA